MWVCRCRLALGTSQCDGTPLLKSPKILLFIWYIYHLLDLRSSFKTSHLLQKKLWCSFYSAAWWLWLTMLYFIFYEDPEEPIRDSKQRSDKCWRRWKSSPSDLMTISHCMQPSNITPHPKNMHNYYISVKKRMSCIYGAIISLSITENRQQQLL